MYTYSCALSPSKSGVLQRLALIVPEGYETDLEELHRTVTTNALETKFDAS